MCDIYAPLMCVCLYTCLGKGRFKIHFCVFVHIQVTVYPPLALAPYPFDLSTIIIHG